MQITSWGEVALDKRRLKALMRSAGTDIASKTRRLISQTAGSGRYYAGGGGSAYRGSYRAEGYYASAPGQPPVSVTGTLRRIAEGLSLTRAAMASPCASAPFTRSSSRPARAAGATPSAAGANPRPPSAGARHRARGRYQTRVSRSRPHLDRVMAEQEPILERRVRAALDEGMTWRQTKNV